jgi:hypothetical protein
MTPTRAFSAMLCLLFSQLDTSDPGFSDMGRRSTLMDADFIHPICGAVPLLSVDELSDANYGASLKLDPWHRLPS